MIQPCPVGPGNQSRTSPRLLLRYGKRLAVAGALIAASAGSCEAGSSASCMPLAPGAAAALGDALGGPAADPATAATQPITVDGPNATAGDPDRAAPVPPLPQRATVTLVTGDRVTLEVGPGGVQSVSPAVPATGTATPDTGSAGFVRFAWGGDQFAVPNVAVPYLNTLLDPRLFDVTYLVRAGLDDARSPSLPLTIGGTDPAAVGALPGVTLTGTGAGGRTATLAKDQAGQVGRLLAEQWRAARHGGAAPSGAAALAKVSRIGLTTAPGTHLAPVNPAISAAAAGGHHDGLRYRTLTVDFTGPDGKPAPAIGWIQNVDDARLGTFIVTSPDRSARPALGAGGPQKFSVPEGDYSLAFTVLSPHEGTHLGVDAALVVKPEVNVDSDETVTLDARDTVPYSFTLDQPVTPRLRVDTMSIFRTGMEGGECAGEGMLMDLVSVQRGTFQQTALSASPTDEVEKGTLGFHSLSGMYTGSALDPADAPRYALHFPHTGTIPDNLEYHVSSSDLTTIRSHVYDGVPGRCPNNRAEMSMELFAMGTVQFVAMGGLDVVQFGERTDFVYSADPSLSRWNTSVNDCGRLEGTAFVAEHGQERVEHWNKAPEALVRGNLPAGGTHGALIADNPNQVVCIACRQDDNAMLFLRAGADSERAHAADREAPNSLLEFYRDGELAYTSNADTDPGIRSAHGFVLPMSPDAAGYRLIWAAQQPGEDPAATIRTDWTFRSDPGAAGTDLPDGTVCAPDMTRGCTALPLLFVGYDLDLDYHSRAPAGGPFDVAFTVSDPLGRTAADTTATVSVSYDDGRTWTEPVAARDTGEGGFAATVTHPALADTSGRVSIRVHAADGAGNTVDQTIIRAYGLA